MASILIVDDDESQRLLMSALLEEQHTLFFAGDGEAALKIYETERVDLVISDLAMPRLNGLRLIRELAGRRERKPIIAISGAAADQLDLAEDYGARTTLFKPVQKEQLLAAVSEALEEETGKAGPWAGCAIGCG